MKVLVLTDKYYPKPYANAVCAQALIDELNKQKIEVTVLAYKDCGVQSVESWKGNPVTYVKPDLRQRLFYYADNLGTTKKAVVARKIAKVLNRSRKIFLIPWQPMYSFSMPQKILKKINENYKETCFDAIISILNPFELSVAACKFKTKHPHIPVIVYAVDTLRNNYIKGNYAFANGYFWEKRILKKCDKYFYMKARRKEFLPKRYDTYREKLIEVDLPRLEIKNLKEIVPYNFKNFSENWVYAGSMGGIHYDYKEMLAIFERVSYNRNCILHMYIRGSEAEKIKQLAKDRNLPIEIHGYVDQCVLNSIMASCDVLVTLKTSSHISAKIFECISYQKPIVHFSGVENDPNIEYYEKSSAYKVVKMFNPDRNREIAELEKYLNSIKSLRIKKKQIEELYRDSTPKYSVQTILKCIYMDK